MGGSVVAVGTGIDTAGGRAMGGSTVRFGCGWTAEIAVPGFGAGGTTRGPGGGPTGGSGAIVGVGTRSAAWATAAGGGSSITTSITLAGRAMGGSTVWPANPSAPLELR